MWTLVVILWEKFEKSQVVLRMYVVFVISIEKKIVICNQFLQLKYVICNWKQQFFFNDPWVNIYLYYLFIYPSNKDIITFKKFHQIRLWVLKMKISNKWGRFEYHILYLGFKRAFIYLNWKNPCFEIKKTNFKDQVPCQNARIKIFDSFIMIKVKKLMNEPLMYYK